MKIQTMFSRDINRDINGVVKVTQDDERSLKQELEEYIVTKELRRHFDTFFENYSRAIEQPTDKVGVWISGFFGSGKSHFLKILSYLLANRIVGGKNSAEYFADKFDDPMAYATLVRCATIPTETILFNIDIEGPIQKDKTAVLRVFAKVFYNHLGYYGEDLKIAKLERFIDSKGKTDEFRTAFEEINGESWLNGRSTYAFFEDDIVAVLQKTLGISETAARNWFNGVENADMSIKQLVEDIRDYVESKGKNFRLLFCVDEIGQYIGSDVDLMLNLQSIVEEVGDKCRGKVWVMVTSQEAIDSVVKIAGDDFSKIQGRFNTKLSLSSASVDEVIKKRILEKTEDSDRQLRLIYDKEQAVLKNLFTFNNDILDIKGYSGGREFSATYPFVPYQFIVIQKVLAEIRKHGNSGKHLSGGERSMLSGFQEAAQTVQDKDENALVPFHKFYDTVHTFLESTIRRVIDRCQNAADNQDGIKQQDVYVLKLLYLLRYIDDIKTNIDNIAILMVDDIRSDKITMRKDIQESLDRLLSQNYIARNGDTYSFLTDDEQDISIEIKNTSVDSANIITTISQIIFGDIYPTKKIRYKKCDFNYDQYVDETLFGAANGDIRLRFVTVASDDYDAPEEKLIMSSGLNHEVAVFLSDETPYFEELEQAAKIRKYIKQKNVTQLPESIQGIIRKYQQQATFLEKSIKALLEKAIVNGKFYICGEKETAKGGDVKAILDSAMNQLAENVYTKVNYINTFCEDDSDILKILNSSEAEQGVLSGMTANNGQALNEISQWLEIQSNNHMPVSMFDIQKRYKAIPYGWREIDIAALVARLVVGQKISVHYGGAIIGKDDRRLVDYLRKKSEVEKVSIKRRVAPSEDLVRKSIAFLRNWLGQMDIPDDEDGLLRYVADAITAKAEHYKGLLDKWYQVEKYPEKQIIKSAYELMQDVLSQSNDNVALLNRLIQKQDDLLDCTEDMQIVEDFFKSQREIFDAAWDLKARLYEERDYFAVDTDTNDKLSRIAAILAMPKPYNAVKDLSELMQAVRNAETALLQEKKEEVSGIIIQCRGDVHTLAGSASAANDIVAQSDTRFAEYQQKVKDATSLTSLDAMIMQLLNYKDTVCKRIEAVTQVPTDSGSQDGVPAKPQKIVQVRRYDVFPVKRIQSREDVDSYVETIREKLYKSLENNDGVQIS